jgi:predicted nucleic acid-binding protein
LKIVLDTDVTSGLIRADQNPDVVEWARSLQSEEVFVTTTTISELVLGVMRMPEGRRKNELDDDVSALITIFQDRIIDFDFSAAVELGRLVPDRFAIGRPIERADAQIAACSVSNGAVLATRNTKDFEEIPGLELINPWEAA